MAAVLVTAKEHSLVHFVHNTEVLQEEEKLQINSRT